MVRINQNKDEQNYIKELQESIEKIRNSNKMLRNLNYFINLTNDFFDEFKMKARKPEVIVLGTSIPEAILYACGCKPMWILGGSLGTSLWADSLVPRDTDDVSQSILGFLKNDHFDITSNATIIIPITCDSMRKISYIMSKQAKVITVDVPPDKMSESSTEKWISQMWRLATELSKISKKKMTKDSLKEAVGMVNVARYESRRFVDNCSRIKNGITDATRMFILNSYYFADNILEWTKNLAMLNHELEGCVNANIFANTELKPRVLLMGSPILFPNYKIPFLLETLNLEIAAYVSSESQRIYIKPEEGRHMRLEKLFENVVMAHYNGDCSAAFVNNITMYNYVLYKEKEAPFQGVIFHVLKGQIEYDFELSRYEEYFTSKGIPVFRMETDYKYHDIEQIRIRVEAFAEMLTQGLYRERNHAV